MIRVKRKQVYKLRPSLARHFKKAALQLNKDKQQVIKRDNGAWVLGS
jgi:hypothetical protein